LVCAAPGRTGVLGGTKCIRPGRGPALTRRVRTKSEQHRSPWGAEPVARPQRDCAGRVFSRLLRKPHGLETRHRHSRHQREGLVRTDQAPCGSRTESGDFLPRSRRAAGRWMAHYPAGSFGFGDDVKRVVSEQPAAVLDATRPSEPVEPMLPPLMALRQRSISRWRRGARTRRKPRRVVSSK